MALESQIIELPFSQGLDTKSDPNQIPLGKLLTMQNAVMTSPGQLKKRNGYASLANTGLPYNGAALGAIMARGNELCGVSKLSGAAAADNIGTLYSYNQSLTNWVNKGSMPSVSAAVAPLATTQYSTVSVDMAQSAAGLQCTVYEIFDFTTAVASKRGIGYSITDSLTGQIVVPPATLDSTATSICPRVVVLGANFWIYYIQGDLAATAGIYAKSIPTATPATAPSAAVQLTSGVTGSAQKIALNAYNYDVMVSASAVYLSFNARDNSTTVFRSTDGTTVAGTLSFAGTNSRISTVFPDVNGNIVVGWATATAAFVAIALANLSGTVVGTQALDTATAGFNAITGVSTAAHTIQFMLGDGTTNTNQILRSIAVTGAGYTVGAASSLIRHFGLAGRSFTYAPSGGAAAAYFPVWFCANAYLTGNSNQTTLFLLDASGNILSKALATATGGYSTISASSSNLAVATFYNLSNTTVSGNTVILPATFSNRLADIVNWAGAVFINYQWTTVAVTWNFNDTTNGYLRAQLANSVHTSGGVLQMYDGQAAVEHGFLLYPFSITATAAGSGGYLSAGVYQYVAVYSWMDGQGQIHRSTPSVAKSVTCVANDSVTLVCPTLCATAKTGVFIDWYRTVANGSTFYQISNFNNFGSCVNDKTVGTVSFTDKAPDTTATLDGSGVFHFPINTNPQLYSSTQVSASACNPAGPMTTHRNRLFAVDSTNQTQIWFGKQVSQPYPVEFSSAFILNVDPKGGAITALASLDDKLIVFKSDRTYMILGQGPDATGGQNDFTDAILISADTGCANPISIVLVPDGIMFQSPKGMYLLSRALQMTYLGWPSEGVVSGISVGGGVLDPAHNTIRWGLVGGSVSQIVYDYFTGQWSTQTINGNNSPSSINDNTVWQSSVVALAGGLAASVLQETAGQYYDTSNSNLLGISVSTGWIKLSGIQGFQRVRRLLILGTYKSPHTLTVQIDYNYVSGGSLRQTTSITVAGSVTPLQYRIHLAQQKCESIRVTILETPTSGTLESLSLSGLAFEIAAKRGAFRVIAAQSA